MYLPCIPCSVYYLAFLSCRNFELFFAVAGSGSKDGKSNKDNNSPSGPYAGKLDSHSFHVYLNILDIKNFNSLLKIFIFLTIFFFVRKLHNLTLKFFKRNTNLDMRNLCDYKI